MNRLDNFCRRPAGLLFGALAAMLCVAPAVVCHAAFGRDAASFAGLEPEDVLLLGERMYREGRDVEGEPLKARVAGDVPVEGGLFTCVHCHRRSGLGSLEGSVIAWPISGKELFVPRRRAGTWNPEKQHIGPGAPERWSLPPRFRIPDIRPAYTEETLARVLRTGVDPAGRVLSRAMPRYDLDDRNMAVLIRYLKSLSTHWDPGADEQSIRFATVVTEGVPEADRDAMLAVLRAHIDARNTQTRPYERRAKAGPFYKTERYGAYRKLALDVWELKGGPDTWRDQLEAYYQDRPVFALLGGIAAGSWAPVHEFCEEHEIPSIFPITDQPVVSDSDWYTLYFSKGLYQEGEAAARFLADRGMPDPGARILQLFRTGTKGEGAARGFRETWEGAGRTGLSSQPLAAGDDPSVLRWADSEGEPSPAVLLLWLEGREVIEALKGTLALTSNPAAVFASWSLAAEDLGQIPEAARERFYVTYPYSLPQEAQTRLRVVDAWTKARKIPPGDRTILAEMYFLGWMLPGAISAIRSEFYRDYFLEAFEMMPDQDYAIPIYPRLSFGPGQRYAAKGCYVARLSPGDAPRLVKASGWVVN